MQWNSKKVTQLKKYRTKKYKRPYPYNIPWKGAKPVPFEVYKIPTELLSFNFVNTRIKAELEGTLYKRREKPDVNNPKHHKIVQNILLTSKWIGELETTKLTDDLQKRGQLDPVIATPDGTLIDGNRRLAIFRYLQENEALSKGFGELETCFLPENATKDDLKELEMRIQMYHQFQVPYGDINTALEFRYLHEDLHWTKERISDITGNQYTETQIEKMIDIINIIDEYLDLVPPEGTNRKQYAILDKGWESFDNIYRMLKWTEKTSQDVKIKEFRKLFGFQIICSDNTTYADVRRFYSVLRNDEARKRLENLSDTLKGKYLNGLLSSSRIEREIENLEDAHDYLSSLKAEPKRIAEQALKKLDTIKFINIDKTDREFKIILDRLINKITKLKERLT